MNGSLTKATSSSPTSTGKQRLRSAGQWALVLLALVGVRAFMQRGIATGSAPALVGRDLDGQAVSLDDYRGKAVLVHFWATWCSVCDAESGTLDALARDHTMLTVATDSGQAGEIRAGMKKRGLSFPVVVDSSGALARAWGVHAFPTSFFVGPKQDIRFTEIGYTSSPGFRARLWLAGR